MCTRGSGVSIAPGMLQSEFDAIEGRHRLAALTDYVTDKGKALDSGAASSIWDLGLNPTNVWNDTARSGVQADVDQWIADNPERHRLGALSAAGKPTKQSARSPQGSANPQAAPAAGVGGGLEGSQADISGTGAAGAFQLGADALALSKRRKSLLGG